MMILAEDISRTAIFNAVVTVGCLIGTGMLGVLVRSYLNAATLVRIESQLKTVNLEQMQMRVNELWEDRIALWDFMRYRGDAEVEVKKLGRRNSPIDISGTPTEAAVLKAYKPYIEQLKNIEREHGLNACKHEDESLLWKVIAKVMNKKFSTTVCPELSVFEGGCVSLAIAVLRKTRQEEQKRQQP